VKLIGLLKHLIKFVAEHSWLGEETASYVVGQRLIHVLLILFLLFIPFIKAKT
jgi:hypothetical protein